MDKAVVFGTKDCRFESCQGHICYVCDWSQSHMGDMRPCGLMNKALVFGTKDCRFESCQGHICVHIGGLRIIACEKALG